MRILHDGDGDARARPKNRIEMWTRTRISLTRDIEMGDSTLLYSTVLHAVVLIRVIEEIVKVVTRYNTLLCRRGIPVSPSRPESVVTVTTLDCRQGIPSCHPPPHSWNSNYSNC